MEDRGELMRSWTPDHVREFLINNKIKPAHAEALFEEVVRGEFLFSSEINDFRDLELPIPKSELILIIKAKENYLKGSNNGTNTTKKEERQIPRQFGEPVGDVIYKVGSILPCENTHFSLEEPLREFKAFSLDKTLDKEEEERAFIERLGKFSAACINSRYNGTIYFGVTDSKDGTSSHGEVRGINKPYSSLFEYEEWIEKHFRKNPISLIKTARKENVAFSECISSLRIIPLLGSEKFVLEVDIAPTFSKTKYMNFKIVQQKYPKGVYFVRIGSSSVPLAGKDEKEFLERKSVFFAEQRKELEMSTIPVDLPQKLTKLLCKGEQKLDDNQYQYFLLMNRFCTEGCCNMKNYSDFDWIKLVHWRAVFDFDSKTTLDGTWHILNDKVPLPPYHISGTDLTDLLQKDSNGKALTTMCEYGKKTLHISCCGDDSGDFSHWRETYLSEITLLFRIITSASMLEDPSKLVFVICACSDDRKREMDAFLKAIFIKPKILDACVFIGQNSSHSQFIRESIIHEGFHSSGTEYFRSNSVCIRWEELSAFVQQAQTVMTEKKYIATSANVEIEIKPHIIGLFKKNGFSVLPSNECATLAAASMTDLKNSFENTMRSFLQGKEADWNIFYYCQNINDLPLEKAIPSALIKREIIGDIETKMKVCLDDIDKCIAVLGVGHLPGTGATTAAKHLLWRNKSRHRCAMIDGRIIDDIDVKTLASSLLSFRALGEDENVIKGISTRSCLPLLIILDNSSLEAAENLQRKMQDEVDQQGIKFERSIGIIVYVHGERSQSQVSQMFLGSSFSEAENQLFKSKLMQFSQIDLAPSDMLGFLSLMNRDDSKNYEEYVSGVVENIIEVISISYPTELILLLYLAIFKSFHEDGNISVSHAKLILGYSTSDDKCFLRNTCEYFNMLVNEYEKYGEGFGSYYVLEITHSPVAEILLKQLLRKRKQSVFEAMIDVIDNKSFLNKRFLQDKLIKDLVDISIKRRLKKLEQKSRNPKNRTSVKKEDFSPLIQAIRSIRKEDGIIFLQRFISVLEKMPNVNEEKSIGNVYQTLARFHLEYKDYDKAKEAAKEAIQKEHSFAYYDTLGQIYKKELISAIETQSKELDCNKLLEIASSSAYNFRKAQDIGKTLKNRTVTKDEDVEYQTNDDIPYLRKPGFLGEIQTIEIVGEELLKRIPVKMKDQFRQYISGDFDIKHFKRFSAEMEIDIIKYGTFLTKLQERSHECFSEVMRDMDARKIQSNLMTFLQSKLKNHNQIFLTSSFMGLVNFLKKPKVLAKKKLQEVEKCCQWNMLFFWYSVDTMEKKHLKLMRDIIEETYKQKIDVDNFIKICMLNVNISKLDSPILPFKSACSYSLDLTNVESEELLQYETFFWYLVLHWPTPMEKEKKKYAKTYDEEKMSICIQKLKTIQGSNAYYVQTKHERQRQNLHHNPLFFLKDGLQYDKLTNATNEVERFDRIKLLGSIRDRSNIELVLDGGTKIVIRAANLRYNRGRPAEKVKFTLGFTLSGPVAYQIETSDNYIQRLNDT